MNPALILMVGGSLLSAGAKGYGAYSSIKQSRYAADIMGYQADYARAAAEIEVEKHKLETTRLRSSQKAATAASGFQTGYGSPVELDIETQILAEIDQEILRNSGGLESLRFNSQAHAAQAQGLGRAAGYSASSFGTLLSAGEKFYARQYGYGR